MPRAKNGNFNESLFKNMSDYYHYFNRLCEMWLSRFKWLNLPDTVDSRFMEISLLTKGNAVFFFDDDMEEYLCLPSNIGGQLDVYGIPIKRNAYSMNGYQKMLDKKNSVLIFNNKLHIPCELDLIAFSRRLENIDRTIDVNVHAQKTPIIIACDEKDKLALKNMYMKYDGNQPLIWGDKRLSEISLSCIHTDAPYISEQLYNLKVEIWNEALTYMGISNIPDKKERRIVDEIQQDMGGVLINREIGLSERKIACDKINKMFGLNVDVTFSGFVYEDLNIDKTENGGVDIE